MPNSAVSERLLAQIRADQPIFADPVRTDEDKDVWTSLSALLQQLWKSHESSLHSDYLSGLNFLNISVSEIPSLSDINKILSGIGWSAAYVDGMVDGRLYQEMLAERVFPVAGHIRRKRDMFHSAAPDFMHDVIGHLPMLFSPQYQSLLNEWARRALEAQPDAKDVEVSKALSALIEEREKESPDLEAIARKTAILEQLHQETSASPSRAARFARFYAWAIEFGVAFGDDRRLKIGGSAVLSSPEEFKRIVSGKTQLRSFTEHAINSPVNYSVVQHAVFIATDFSEYAQVLAGI
jgi:phenylalanine-4-hydroxylase